MSVPGQSSERVPRSTEVEATATVGGSAPATVGGSAPATVGGSAPATVGGSATATATASPGSVTATFLMTDIAGSTRLWAEERDAMTVALAAHDAILRDAVGVAGGHVFKTTGDGMLAVFERSDGAVRAALAAQRGLAAHDWPTATPLLVRMAIHAGTADVRDGDYFGPTLNRLARLLAIGHGGQILATSVAAGLVEDDLPAGAGILDRGEHRLRDIDRLEHVFQVVAPDLRVDFPQLRSGVAGSNLPPELTSFVGRERELVEVRELLGRRRLVTLVGVGGTGKTRLMLHLAAGIVDAFADGVWLVELAPIADPGLVTQTVARALGVPDTGRPELDSVLDFLREKDLLLLLDNCEHVIDAVASLAERLLLECRSLRMLATSREGLAVSGEASVQVPSLGLPGGPGDEGPGEALDPAVVATADAVQLFVDRASATLPGFTLDGSTVGPVVEICRRLDGIPLALELAAARVSVLSVAEIAQGLGDRFRLLTGGRRTAVPRQQTLQALIDWSWDLLTESDQRLLRRLSVFADGWTLDAAAEVAAEPPDDASATGSAAARMATLDGLGRLVDRSLVVVEHGAETRYGMLETIRQYASDKLVASGEAPALRDRHLARFLGLVVEVAPALTGSDMVRCLDHLDAELGNVRSSLDWARESVPQVFVGMVAALGPFWRYRSIGTEGMELLQEAIEIARALPEPPPEARAEHDASLARLLAGASIVGSATNRRTDAVREWADEAVALAEAGSDRSVLGLARISRFLAVVLAGERFSGEVLADATSVVDVAEELGDATTLAQAGAAIAIHLVATDAEAAVSWLARADDAARRSGNPFAIGFAEMGWGQVLSYLADLDGARAHAEQAEARFREVRDVRMVLVVRSNLSHALRRAGLLDEALAEYRATVLEWLRLGQRGAIANQLEAFAFVDAAQGRDDRAPRLLGAADRLREVSSSAMLTIERAEYDAAVAKLRERLGDEAFEVGRAEGRALTTEQAVALAREA